MSRRKQAKPRALKRDLSDTEDESTNVTMETDKNLLSSEESSLDDNKDVSMAYQDTMDTDQLEDETVNNDIAVTTVDEDEVGAEEEYRCETCNASFLNLLQFMDHRNFDCLSGESWLKSNSVSPSASRSSSPYSVEAGKSPSLPQGSPYSPTSSSIALDQIPYSIGVNENNPYACQFCEKAFARLSYLKRHEQVHSDQMPFKCDYCSRLFKHKRSRDRHVKLHTGDKKYKCVHCESAFSRSDHLKIHLKTHDNGKPFQCTTCNRGYTTAAALTSHTLTHKKTAPSGVNGENKDFKCLHCAEVFLSSSEMNEHMHLHESNLDQDKMLSCMYCGEFYISQMALDAHIEHEHSKDSSRLVSTKCPVCDALFLNSSELYQHMKSHGGVFSAVDESSHHSQSSNATLTVSANSPITHNCPFCSKSSFPSREVLEIHLHTMHGGKSHEYFSCQHCSVICPSLFALQEHLKIEHKNIYGNQTNESGLIHCNYCTMEFMSSESLQSHKEKVHKFTDDLSKSADYVLCTHCTMTFPSSLALGEHMHSIHGMSLSQKSPLLLNSPISSSAVESCHVGQSSSSNNNNNKFSTKSKSPVSNQMLSPNTALKPSVKQEWDKVNIKKEAMTCDLCNATFYDLKLYQSHLTTHQTSTTAQWGSNSKYTCTECSAEFTSEDQLESHVFVHFLALTTEYGCTSCLKLFSKPDELQKHLMDIHAHHLYRCSLCKEIFDSKVNVQVHFAIKHSNECKLYKCTTCASVFRSEMEWQLHVKVNHLGISKPYRCLFCKDSFGSEMELQCHLTTHKKAFPCPLCEEAFHVEYLLDKHMQSKHCHLEANQQTTKIKHEKEMEVVDYTTNSACKDESAFAGSSHNHVNNKVNVNHRPSTVSPHKDKAYKCDVCDIRFTDEQSLLKHQARDHIPPPEIKKSPIKLPEYSPAKVNTLSSSVSDKFGQLCVYCNQSFKTKGELEKHMKTHVSPSNQKCNICDEIFPSASILAEHKLMHCKVVQGNMCVVCKVALKNEDAFYTHAQQHGFQGAHMQCIVCRQTLASMLELQMHGKHHFQNPTAFFTCCVCLKSYDSKENLVSKLNSSGRSYYVCKPCYHGEVVAEVVCQHCGLKFETQSQLEAHMVEHKKTYQCIKCQQSFCSEYEIQAHVAEHMMQEGNVHECKLCKTSFESPAKLQCHLIEHTFADSDFQCYVCGATFSHSSVIQMHALEHGIGARRYACTHCPQKFFFSAELENHLYSHGVQQPTNNEFQCPDCNKVFTSIINLTTHRKIHENSVKSIKCSLCAEVFGSMTQLQQHFFSVHADADLGGARPTFSCTECDMEFPCLSNLQGHMRIHNSGTKFSCKECGKDFALARNLNIHMRSHSGEKPYECPICHKRFARKENRKAHLKSHSGLKPYLCPVCGKSFSRKCHVKDHLRVHVNPTVHSCQVCSETFQQAKHLRRHLVLVHNKTIENACHICNETFSLSKNLKRHMIKVHKIDNMDSPVHSPESMVTDNDFDIDTSDSQSLASDSSIAANGVDSIDASLDEEELFILRHAKLKMNGDHHGDQVAMEIDNRETNNKME